MKFRLPVFLSISLLPSLAQACSVCFGGADGNFRKGFTWGILILLVLPFAIIGGFVSAIVRSTRRKAPL